MNLKILASLALILTGWTTARAQVRTIHLSVDPRLSTVHIEADGAGSINSFSFADAYAGINGLGDRIQRLEVVTEGGEVRSAERIAPGEFRYSPSAKSFRYDIKITPPASNTEMAHVSWLNENGGFLMLGDLLPNLDTTILRTDSVTIEFSLPQDWSVASASTPIRNRVFTVTEPEKSVFFVAKNLQERSIHIGPMEFSIVTANDWSFTNNDVNKLVRKIIDSYSDLTQFKLGGRAVLMLASFPGDVTGRRWSAETRGSTVMLVLGSGLSRADSLGQLGVILTHELFHLWVPNGLELAGDYDWFYEGFTLYVALKTALSLGLINFDEYLKTMARVYRSYRSFPGRDELSLVEASRSRWSGQSSLIYDKGMLVAFIYDLNLRMKSGGRASLEEVYRLLFSQQLRERANANEVIIRLLERQEGMSGAFKHYIEGRTSIELERLVAPFGLKLESERLVVNAELTRDQRKLLRSIGYKN